MELSEINTAVSAALPTAYVAPLSGLEVPDSVAASEPTPAELAAEQAERIATLEAALAAQILKGNNRDVQLPDGETLTVKAASRRLEDMSLDVQLEALKANRFIAELADAAAADKPLAASRPLLPDRDAAVALVGRATWNAATNVQKAIILDTRQSDIDKLKPEDIFGAKSDSRAAHELNKANPAAYKLLRREAVRRGLVV